ncbi:hypothetical protein [Methylobacterium platani]|nr:hypothetical protein [Methylobacterium platani]
MSRSRAAARGGTAALRRQIAIGDETLRGSAAGTLASAAGRRRTTA